MRAVIILVVIIGHLVAVLLFLGPCSSTPGPSGSESERERGVQEDVPEPAAERSAGGADHVRYSDDVFVAMDRDLPAELTAAGDTCRTGILVDWTGKRCLWRRAELEPVPIASLTKMMTVLLLMETVRADAVGGLAQEVPVSVASSRIGGRQVWLDPRESFTLDELMKAVMIRSANDCAYLIGEHVGGGDAAAFVKRMNRRAHELGMARFVFYNAHGLPATVAGEERENMGCAAELAFLAALLLQYPEVVEYSSTRLSYLREDTDKPFQLVNTNRLITTCPGVNGMKTGYTSASGYCLAATCERGGRVLVAVATGFPTANERDAFVAGLIDWGFALP